MLSFALVLLSAAPPTNLLIVTIDTLRADRVGAYGYAGAETKALDRLAAEGILLDDATVQVPETLPSHASIFTGRLPYEHGVRDNYSPPLKTGLPTLAEVLRSQGYETAAVIGAYPVTAASGLRRGFEHYDDPFGPGKGDAEAGRIERPATEVAASALAFLRKPRTRPFFLWAHFFDPHYPYEPPSPYAERFARRPYDGEVAYADGQLGRLLDHLDKSGLRGQTLVVVTSDHGEGLGDHGEDEHMLFVYESTLRVPLLLSWPGSLPAGVRVSGQFRSVDLMATLLGLLGVPAPATSGESRAEILRRGGRIPDNESYVEALFGSLRFGYAPLRALRAEGWKYVDLPRPELYRLTEDPREETNLVDLRAGVAAKMRERLLGYDRGAPARPNSPAPVDPAHLERLAALGYVDGGRPTGATAGAGPDPKDKLGEFQAYRREMFDAMRLYRKGDLDLALPLLTKLAQSEIYSFNVQYFLGRTLSTKGRFDEAAAALESAVRLAPQAVPAQVALVRAWAGAGRLDRAQAVLDRALERAPRSGDLQRERARLLLQQGNLVGARAAVDRALAVQPKNGETKTILSICLRQGGDVPGALGAAEEATKLEPRSPEAWSVLGLAQGAAGQETRAKEAFRKAVALDPEHADGLFYLAAIDLRAGRSKEALDRLLALARKTPAYPGLNELLEVARGQAAPPPPGSIRLRLIRVTVEAQILKVRARLAKGEEFAAVARALSTDKSAAVGGDLGNLRAEDLAEPLRSAAAGLAPGERSAVLHTPDGYVILERDH